MDLSRALAPRLAAVPNSIRNREASVKKDGRPILAATSTYLDICRPEHAWESEGKGREALACLGVTACQIFRREQSWPSGQRIRGLRLGTRGSNHAKVRVPVE